jgi:hypothetical protein
MTRRLLWLTGTALLIGIALVAPTVVVTSAPASAQVVVDGCTIVSNPTPSNFTNCPGANLSTANLTGVNLSYADLAGATFVSCTVSVASGVECTSATLSGTKLTSADLSDVSFAVCFQLGTGYLAPSGCGESTLSGDDVTDANLANATFAVCTNAIPLSATQCGLTDLSGVNLTGADLTGATLQTFCQIFCESANLAGATLTGANFTGTVLVPSNQTVVATSNAGAVVTWPTPPSLPGATPGACMPPSGSSFPLFSTTVTCQVLDTNGGVATGTFQVTVQPTTQYFTRVLVPSNGAVLAGAPYLDAGAGDALGVTKVVFELSGGTLSDKVIATATPTLFGWLAKWNTTTVPNGSYSLESVATDAAANTDTSTPITITVNNPAPTTTVLIPSNGATLSGTAATLDASASNATSVEFALFGGTYGLSGHLIGTATATIYGWLDSWNTATVPNGSYVLVSVASGPGGSGFSPGVTVTVANPGLADLANSSFTMTGSDVVGGNGCSFVYGAIDAVYPGSAAVGNVTLHMAGCVTPSTFTGSFTITTGVGTLSGSATGPIIEEEIGVDLVQIYQVTLSVNAATGSFAGTTGNLLFSTSSRPNVASVAVE